MNEAVNNENTSALVLDTEKELDNEASLVEQQALSVVILNEDDYKAACEVTKTVKAMQKKVTDYWEPMRVSAKKSYDSVLAHKKEMLAPLESAEKILKGKISNYVVEQERKQREAEAEARRLAQEAAEKSLSEAVAAENSGDAETAEYAMTEAEMMSELAASGMSTQVQKPKADGVSTSRAWKITSIDEEKVPIDINGAVIRPVDKSAIMALIKATKGKIKIPGVKYEESVTVSVRS